LEGEAPAEPNLFIRVPNDAADANLSQKQGGDERWRQVLACI